MKHIIIILLLSMSLYSSNVKLSDVLDSNSIEFSYEKEEARKSIQGFTKIFHDYLEGLYGSLPILTLKEKEWLEKEMKRTKENYTQRYKLTETYTWKLNRTYDDLEFYIRKLKKISEGNNIKHMMYDLTYVMNSLRDPYTFEYIQSFVQKKKMPLSALGIYNDDNADRYVLYFKILTDKYFDEYLLRYLRKTDYYIDDSYKEMIYRDYMKLKEDK